MHCIPMKLLVLLHAAALLTASADEALSSIDDSNSASGVELSRPDLSCELPVNTSCGSSLSRTAGPILSFSWVWDTPKPPQPLLKHAAVGGHYVTVDVDGGLWTWGRNDSNGGGKHGSQPLQDSGQLGWPRNSSLWNPGYIVATPRFIAAAAGRYHSAALDENGKLYTWGLNDFGQLGRDARMPEDPKDEGSREVDCTSGWACHDTRVVSVPEAPEKFIALTAGRYHTTVVAASGQVYTTGLNFCGNSHVRSPPLHVCRLCCAPDPAPFRCSV